MDGIRRVDRVDLYVALRTVGLCHEYCDLILYSVESVRTLIARPIHINVLGL